MYSALTPSFILIALHGQIHSPLITRQLYLVISHTTQATNTTYSSLSSPEARLYSTGTGARIMKGDILLGILMFAGVFLIVADIAQLGPFYKYADDHIAPPRSRPIFTRRPLHNDNDNNDSSQHQLDKALIQDTWTTVTRQLSWKIPNILARRSGVSKDDVTLTVHTGPTINGLNRMLFLIHR